MIDPRKQAFSLFNEFKAFALKGNVIDLAVGVIIAGAFGQIVTSLVKNIIMPLVSTISPGADAFDKWDYTLRGKDIHFGLFVGDVLNFVIVAAALFIFIVKFLGWIMRTKKEEIVAPPPPTKDQELLMEIRDLLKSHAK